MSKREISKESHEKPQIELFMYSLHQEFPEGVSHDSFIKRNIDSREILTEAGDLLKYQRIRDDEFLRKANDWPAQWLHAKWVTDHTKAITGIFEHPEADPILLALTREEDFGGIIYDPFSDKVYKVNESGLELFREIQSTLKRKEKVKEFKSRIFKREDTNEFISFLRGAGLWIH